MRKNHPAAEALREKMKTIVRSVESALRNHLGLRIWSQEELDRFLKECPEASLLPDIGHLHGSGGDVVGMIEKYLDRIAAVHFKDVYIKDPGIGLDRWSTRLLMFAAVVIWIWISPWPVKWRGMYYFITMLGVGSIIGAVSSIWFMWGGIRDMLRMFRDLAARKADPDDNGVVRKKE